MFHSLLVTFQAQMKTERSVLGVKCFVTCTIQSRCFFFSQFLVDLESFFITEQIKVVLVANPFNTLDIWRFNNRNEDCKNATSKCFQWFVNSIRYVILLLVFTFSTEIELFCPCSELKNRVVYRALFQLVNTRCKNLSKYIGHLVSQHQKRLSNCLIKEIIRILHQCTR